MILLGLLLFGLFYAIKSPKFQTYLAQKVTYSLSEKIGLPISIDQVEIEFFNKIKFQNFLVEDLNGDSLLFIGNANANLSYFSILNKNLNFSSIKIENVKVNISRAYEDSLFNFQYIKSQKTTGVTEVNDTTAEAWDIVLNDLTAFNTEVNYLDYRAGTLVNNHVEKLNILLNSYEIGKDEIDILKTSLRNPIVQYTKQASHPDFEKKENQLTAIQLPFNLNIESLEIENGNVGIKNNLAKEVETKFKPSDVRLNELHLDVRNFVFSNDSLYSQIRNLSFDENSGLKLKSLSSELIITNSLMALNNIELQTRYSQVAASINLIFDDLSAFSNFIEDVRFDLNLKKSTLHAKDINLFINTNKYHVQYPIFIEGNVYGKVSSFKSKNLDVRTINNTHFNGEFSMNGLPNIEETFISGRVNQLTIDYNNILRIYPPTPLPQSIQKLGTLHFNGNFDGFISDFVMMGNLRTDLGSAYTDLNFKLDKNKNPLYSGNFKLIEFELGQYFGLEDVLGKVSLNASGEGKGLQLNTLDANLEGLIEQIEFKGYSYNNIELNGQVKDKFFKGHLDIEDENIKVNFDGVLDATNEIPSYKFEADFKHFNPQALNLWNKEMVFKAKLKADIMAKTFNDMTGDAIVQDLVINTPSEEFNLGNFNMSSNFLINGERQLTLNSNEIDAFLEGDFDYAYIPDAFKSVLLPNFKKRIPDQKIRFGINIKQEPVILALFAPSIKILKPSVVDGNLDSYSKSILARVDIPVLNYNKFNVVDFNSNIYVNEGDFDIVNSIPQVYFNDSVIINDFSFLINGPRNDLKLKLYADGIKNASFELKAKLITKNKRVRIAFEPSNIYLNNQFWLIDKDNEIRIDESITSRNLKLYNGISELLINLDIGTREQKADLFLSNIFLEDFTQFLSTKDIELKGIVNGKVGMDVTEENPGFYGDLLVENIKVNNYNVGNLNSSATLDLPNKKVIINGNLYGLENEVDINGTYSFDKKSTANDINIDFDIKNFAIYSIEDFIAEYIDNTIGTVSGKVKLKGARKSPNLYGYLDINDVTTTVTYLQTTYNIKNERVEFNKNEINLGESLIVSDLAGNTAVGRGKVLHKNLKDFALDIDVTSNKIQGLNTTYKHNQDFYGKAYIKGDVSFKGPVNDIAINIKGESEGDTKIEIPLLETGTAKNYEFYTFKVKETQPEFIIKKEKKFRVNGVTVNLDLDLDNDCSLSIILDQSSGDILQVKGEGNVKISVPKEGDVEFYGKYNINDGNYLFTLQSIINKKFRIEPNSSINFQGKIEDTKVDVNAVYELRAAPKNLIDDFLVGSDDQTKSEANNRVPVKLLMSLQNNLYEPDINFDVQILQLTPVIKNYVDRKIATLKQYENEMNRQVFSLLVLNQFLPPLSSLDQFTNGININANDAANTVSEFLSNQISRYFNDWLSYFSDDVSLNFNYRNYEQDLTSLSSVEDLSLRRELQLALTTKFLNDRITVNVGGNVDFGENQIGIENSNTTYFGGNASVEYALTENRRFRIKAFTNTDYDYFNNGNITRAGVGLSFKREFDKFRDLKVNKEEFKFNKKSDK